LQAGKVMPYLSDENEPCETAKAFAVYPEGIGTKAGRIDISEAHRRQDKVPIRNKSGREIAASGCK